MRIQVRMEVKEATGGSWMELIADESTGDEWNQIAAVVGYARDLVDRFNEAELERATDPNRHDYQPSPERELVEVVIRVTGELTA